MSMAIETVGLTKWYGKVKGIDGLNLRVEAGDFFGFIGPNGAGKSTTLRTLLGLLSPTGGKGLVLGQDCTKSRKEIHRRVGYMPSETSFYHGMRVRDVLRLSASLRGLDCKKEADELCERLQLDPMKRTDELSLGNRKKVSIVCALQHKPELYLLDEPTSGLDPLIQRAFFELLEQRNAEGATVFFSSHVLGEVQRHCRNAAVIRSGAVVASGAVEELMRTSARRVHLVGVQAPPSIGGVSDVEAASGGVSFLYRGEAGALLQALSAMPVRDLSIAEPDIEEMFMHFYKQEGDSHDAI